MTPRFQWSDDPRDPCPYCVQWDESAPDEAVPMLPDGPADRVYRFTHDACERAVMQYVSEQP